ncbi:MAG: flagellar biosynthesis anti-sigma factor FlgM [Myxococcota bacterium]|nr:flagellar biosynthesis anti-sigma factor FlgM [Myxococcota bacterium]
MKPIQGNPAFAAYQRMSVTRVGGAQSATPATQAVEAARPLPAADVQISTRARELAQSEQRPDTPKIEALKQKLEDGSFKIDLRKVAEKMIDHS